MSVRTRLFALPMPGFLRRACISRLHRLTAEAFGVDAPAGPGSPQRLLETYAAFTRAQAEHVAWDDARAARVQRRLFANALGLGKRLRSRLGITSRGEAMDAARALYRVIGVDFKSCPDSGGFTVSTCFFSAHYSPAVCRMISSLDAGLLSGLTGGAELRFSQRITEGAPACRGVIH